MFSILLLPDLAELRIDSLIGGIGRICVQDTARPEPLAEFGIFRIIRILRLFLGVEVIKIAEELVEAMYRGQMLIAVAQMVLAELAGRIVERLHHIRHARIFGAEPELRAR